MKQRKSVDIKVRKMLKEKNQIEYDKISSNEKVFILKIQNEKNKSPTTPSSIPTFVKKENEENYSNELFKDNSKETNVEIDENKIMNNFDSMDILNKKIKMMIIYIREMIIIVLFKKKQMFQ
jgi:hypothetical protein